MALQPIDLQTLFTQMDKVGKDQAALREGSQIQASLQGQEIQRRAEEQVRSVNEAQNTGEGAEHVKDRKGGSPQEEGKRRREGQSPAEEAPPKVKTIRDPTLGRNIDVSG